MSKLTWLVGFEMELAGGLDEERFKGEVPPGAADVKQPVPRVTRVELDPRLHPV